MVSVCLGRGFFRVEGHARSAAKGEDLVCAAVSALAQALLHGLIEVAGCPVEVRRLESGRLEARWDDADVTSEARAILATFEGSFREIATRNEAFMRFDRVSDETGLPESGSSV